MVMQVGQTLGRDCIQVSIVAFLLFFIKKFLKNIYLFGCIGSQLQQASSLVVAQGVLSCGSLAPLLQHACRIQFPDQGSNPGPLHWERGVLTTVPPGKSHGISNTITHLKNKLNCPQISLRHLKAFVIQKSYTYFICNNLPIGMFFYLFIY